eukprot:sb/3460438/
MMDRAWSVGVEKIIVTAGCKQDIEEALTLVKGEPRLYTTVGVHPTRCGEFDTAPSPTEYMDNLRGYIKDNREKVVALGELGLDYDRTKFCDVDTQKKYFTLQLDLAEEFKLPLFLHSRNCADDFIKIITENRSKISGGVIHSFTGSSEEAKQYLEMGFFIGINGCSLKTEENLVAMASIPTDRLMIETDAPWCGIRNTHAGSKHLPPSSWESKKKEKWMEGCIVKDRCEPCQITQVLDVVAAVRGEDPFELAETIDMRLTRVLLMSGRKKGQYRTPKNYQNPLGIEGMLTHTRGVEIVPKVPRITKAPEGIHSGSPYPKEMWFIQKKGPLIQKKGGLSKRNFRSRVMKRFVDIGANLTDSMFRGVYRGKTVHVDDYAAMMDRAWSVGVEKIIVTTGCKQDIEEALTLVKGEPRLYTTVGVHPTRCGEFDAAPSPTEYMDNLRGFIKDNREKVVALGELGLDYDRTKFCDVDTQKKYFTLQLDLAEEFKLPLFLHSRNCADDFIKIISENRSKISGGVIHSFTGSSEEAKQYLEMGFFIGINGCSLKTEENLVAMASIPTDRLMIETDAPWCGIRNTHAGSKHLPPSSWESKKKEKWMEGCIVKDRCEPCQITQVLDVVAAVRGEDPFELAETIDMRLTRVLLMSGRKKGQYRTPKNYQNPLGIEGMLTHTRGVEIVPKVPRITKAPEGIHSGAIRKVIRVQSPCDIRRDLQRKQTADNVAFTLENAVPYLNQEEERVFLNLIQARKPAPEPKPEFIPRINPEPSSKHESVARGDMEKTVWAMRRRGHEPRADAKPGIVILLVGLLQLPLLFDIARSCAPKNAVPKRLAGPIIDAVVVTVMSLLFFFVFYLFFWVFLPAHVGYRDPWLERDGLKHIAFFWFIFTNTICNYICCVFTEPGTPPKITITPDNAMSISIESCIPKEKICLECKCMKAETTHHCSICKKCVLYMDHHCPFVMGCVGQHNFHFFYSFMMYFYTGMCYAIYMTVGPFFGCHGSPYREITYDCEQVSILSILYIVLCLNLFGATFMNAFNTLALLSNSSTMSCLLDGINAGFKAAIINFITSISLDNFFNRRSRLYILVVSKRRHPLLFFVPPVVTTLKLVVKHCRTKQRTINFKLPRMPKTGGVMKRFVDIGANLTDSMFRGVYRGKTVHVDDYAAMMDRAWSVGVEKIIVTAGCKQDIEAALTLVKGEPRLYTTVGVHPTRCGEFDTAPSPTEYMDNLRGYIKDNREKVVALGELGLDYDRTKFCDVDTQKKYFTLQLDLAEEFKLPLFLHSRNCADDFIKIISENRSKISGGVIHSFTGSSDEAKQYLDMGFFIGINGCSLKTEENLVAMASIPTDRLMIETDAPWCGIRNTHAGSKHVSPSSWESKKKENDMRLTRVLLMSGRKKGQYRTPKNYQNPLGIEGMLTHTRGVEIVPKVPRITKAPEGIHSGSSGMSSLFWLVGIVILLVGLLQLPLLFDIARSCAPKNAVPKRLAGPIIDAVVVTVMSLLFFFVFYLFFWVFLPAHVGYRDPWLERDGLKHIAFFWFIFTNTICNYICCVFTEPGTPPKITITPDNAMSISIESCIPKEKICLECKCMKAETTHHCSICKKCVLYMDHHCPFVMGCVGQHNFHFFYSFMMYFYTGMCYAIYMTVGPFFGCHGSPYREITYDCEQVSILSILYIVLMLNLFGATFMNAFNTLALLSNTSTMSCLLDGINAGFKAAIINFITSISLDNFFNRRSRLYILVVSKRRHPLLFFVPPVVTTLKLVVKHCRTKQRTINFKLPRMPKTGGVSVGTWHEDFENTLLCASVLAPVRACGLWLHGININFRLPMANKASFVLKHTRDCDGDTETAKDLIHDLLDEIDAELVQDPEYNADYASFEFECQSDSPFEYYQTVEKWCEEREYRGWCNIRKNTNMILPYYSHVLTDLSELSIGNFPDVSRYIKHVELKPSNCKRMLISFENDVQRVTCFILTTEEWYKLEFEFRSVEGFVVGDLFSEEFTVYLPIRNPPKIWCASVNKIKIQERWLRENREEKVGAMSDEEFEDEMIRTVYFDRTNRVASCNPEKLGYCSVFQFCIQSIENSELRIEMHKQVVAGFLKHGYTVYFSAIDPNVWLHGININSRPPMANKASFVLKHTRDCDGDTETAKDLIHDLLDEIDAELVQDPEYNADYASFEFECQSDSPFEYYQTVEKWCEEREYRGWCNIRKNTNMILPYYSHVLTDLSELSIGNFPDVSRYIKHVELKPSNCKRMLISFENDVQRVTCFILTTEEWYKLEFEFRSVEGFVVGDLFSEEFTVYLPIRNPPKIWCASVNKIKIQERWLRENREEKVGAMSDEEFEDEMIRTVYFDRTNRVASCNPEKLGYCSVFQFCIQSIENSELRIEMHKQVVAGFLKHGYTVYFSAIDPNGEITYRQNSVDKLLRAIPPHIESSRSLFAVRYSIMILLSAGTRVTDHLTLGQPVFNAVKSLIGSLRSEEDIVPLTKTFALLCMDLDKRRFLNISEKLKDMFEVQKEAYYEKDIVLQKQRNFRLVRRVTITPTRVLFQPPELNATNRVLREYGEDNFIRVNLRDEDMGPLNIGVEDQITEENPVRIADYLQLWLMQLWLIESMRIIYITTNLILHN